MRFCHSDRGGFATSGGIPCIAALRGPSASVGKTRKKEIRVDLLGVKTCGNGGGIAEEWLWNGGYAEAEISRSSSTMKLSSGCCPSRRGLS